MTVANNGMITKGAPQKIPEATIANADERSPMQGITCFKEALCIGLASCADCLVRIAADRKLHFFQIRVTTLCFSKEYVNRLVEFRTKKI